jgi:hypothetical protein
MKLYTKEELIKTIQKIFNDGWHKSVKRTIDKRNDGAVGNTLESLLGIKENNLPLPNAREWELKGQRKHTTSLVTLKHIEPSPTGAKIVSSILLPLYGGSTRKLAKNIPKRKRVFALPQVQRHIQTVVLELSLIETTRSLFLFLTLTKLTLQTL